MSMLVPVTNQQRRVYQPIHHDDLDVERVRDVLKYYDIRGWSKALIEDLAVLIKMARGDNG